MAISIAFVGFSGVGKSSLMSQLIYKIFPTKPCGELKDCCHFERDGYKWKFFYTSGLSNKGGDSMRYYSVQLCDLIVYTYAWDNIVSRNWLKTIMKNHPSGKPAIFVCNKMDIIFSDMDCSFATDSLGWEHGQNQFGVPCVFVSAKEGTNIAKLYNTIFSISTSELTTKSKQRKKKRLCVVL